MMDPGFIHCWPWLNLSINNTRQVFVVCYNVYIDSIWIEMYIYIICMLQWSLDFFIYNIIYSQLHTICIFLGNSTFFFLGFWIQLYCWNLLHNISTQLQLFGAKQKIWNGIKFNEAYLWNYYWLYKMHIVTSSCLGNGTYIIYI